MIECSKCGSMTWIDRDAASGGQPVMRCRCGLYLYGESAVRSAVMAYKEKAETARRVALDAEIERQAREVERQSVVVSVHCSWDPCSKMRRKSSKYCSRDCSNKNARARHAARRTA